MRTKSFIDLLNIMKFLCVCFDMCFEMFWDLAEPSHVIVEAPKPASSTLWGTTDNWKGGCLWCGLWEWIMSIIHMYIYKYIYINIDLGDKLTGEAGSSMHHDAFLESKLRLPISNDGPRWISFDSPFHRMRCITLHSITCVFGKCSLKRVCRCKCTESNIEVIKREII